jgi:uncharacterized protein involved in response to NO
MCSLRYSKFGRDAPPHPELMTIGYMFGVWDQRAAWAGIVFFSEIDMGTMAQLRAYQGPALLSYGFRPFFLFGALYAALVMAAWLPVFQGELALASAFGPIDWHVHEMLYGYLPAVITGFLFTAIPNWTGRLPIKGAPLLALVAIWIAGRLAVTLSAWIGWAAAALIDVSFLALVAAMAAREIIAGRNWGNLKVVILLTLLFAGNVAFHLEAHAQAQAWYGARAGIAVVILLIMVIGGRIIPSFTTNWLKRNKPGRLPVPFNGFDNTVLGLSAAAFVAWLALSAGPLPAVVLTLAGIANIARLARWAGDRTLPDRLLLILHIGYAFVPFGFLLMAAASLGLIAESAALHAWTAGAVGVMTLAVMTRVSLGHTGRALAASGATQAIYAIVIVAALARICAGLHPGWSMPLLHLAATAWTLAFLGFAVVFGPALCRPRGKG